MSGVYVFSFGLNNLNNGRLTGVKAMPAKDLTSDADSSFASDRRAYENILAVDTATPLPSQISQKKWIGGCRDASDVSYRRRIAAAGASMNPSAGAFSFTSKTEKNTRIDALTRCRSQGNCVPPKVRASPHRTGVPTPLNPTPKSLMPKYTVCKTPCPVDTSKKVTHF